MGIIFYSSSKKLPVSTAAPDYVLHFLGYALLGFLLARAVRFSFPNLKPPVSLLLAVSIGALYGVSDELHQSFVPGRHCSGPDMMMDLLGCFAGAAAAWAFRKLSFGFRGARKRV